MRIPILNPARTRNRVRSSRRACWRRGSCGVRNRSRCAGWDSGRPERCLDSERSAPPGWRKLSRGPRGHPKAQSGGLVDESAGPVDPAALRRLLARWALEGMGGVRLLRFKGVFHAENGPLLAEIAQNRVSLSPLPHSPPGERVDWIADGPFSQSRLSGIRRR